jgi:photosystem II stability/assembly factor-like uncharacterized protein
MMEKMLKLTVCGLVLSLLAACSRSASLTPTATPLSITPLPPTLTAPPPTATPVPLPVSGLTELHMQDASRGWAWASKSDNSFLLLTTADGGLTWKDVTPPNLPVVSFGSFFLDADTAWVQLFDSGKNTSGLARTTNGGRTWTELSSSLQPQGFPVANPTIFFRSPTDGWAETADVGAGNVLFRDFKTGDGGVTWSVIPIISPIIDTGQPTGTVHLCSICGDALYYDPSRVIITYGDMATGPGGAVRLAVSTDLGQTWKNQKLPLPSGQYAGYLIAPQAPTFFGQNDGLMPVQMTANNANFAPTTLAVYVTHDGGQTWSAGTGLAENVSPYDRADFVSLQDGFTRCGIDLCATHDGAQTWKTLHSSLNFSTNSNTDYVFHFDFVSATTGWAITTDGTVATLWKTVDGGTSWTKLAPTLVP